MPYVRRLIAKAVLMGFFGSVLRLLKKSTAPARLVTEQAFQKNLAIKACIKTSPITVKHNFCILGVTHPQIAL